MKLKITLFLALLFIAGRIYAIDAYVSNLSIGSYVKTSTNYAIKMDVFNNSSTAMTTCTVGWKLDNDADNTQTLNIGGGGLTTGYLVHWTFSGQLNIPTSGAHVLKVWVSAVGDANAANDMITKNTIALSSYASGKVLVEELTGTWCPHCPDGLTAVESIAQNPNTITSSFHAANGDTYEFANGAAHMYSYFPTTTTYFPSAVINMGEMGGYDINSYTTSWQGDAEARVGIAPVEIKLGSNYNSTTKVLTVTVTANFKYALTGSFFINAYVQQNNIAGSQDDNGTYRSWTFNHLVRAMLGGSGGTGGIIPSSPTLNTNYSKTYTLAIDPSWNVTNIANIEVVGLVFQKNSTLTSLLNAERSGAITGINDLSTEKNSLQVYPNPISSSATIALKNTSGTINYSFVLYDVLGNVVRRMEIRNEVSDFDRDNLAPGMYFYNLISKEGEVLNNGKLIMKD